jgi:hypothetical protein
MHKIPRTWVDTLQRGSVIRCKKSKIIRIILNIELGVQNQVRNIKTFYTKKTKICTNIERSQLLELYEKMDLKYRFTQEDLEKEKRYYESSK